MKKKTKIIINCFTFLFSILGVWGFIVINKAGFEGAISLIIIVVIALQQSICISILSKKNSAPEWRYLIASLSIFVSAVVIITLMYLFFMLTVSGAFDTLPFSLYGVLLVCPCITSALPIIMAFLIPNGEVSFDNHKNENQKDR